MKERYRQHFSRLLERGSLHPAVEIYQDTQMGLGLRVKLSQPSLSDGGDDQQAPAAQDSTPPTVQSGHKIVTCPFSLTLSALNAVLPDPFNEDEAAFSAYFTSNNPPHVLGRFFLIKQWLLGPKSAWHDYVATLPQPERIAEWALPPFWPDNDPASEYLEGTSAGIAAREVKKTVRREFKAAIKTLEECGMAGWQQYTPLLYRWAYCIFTSRAFRPSAVWDVNEVERWLPEGVWRKMEGHEDGFSVLLPVVDIANHGIDAKVMWDTESREHNFVDKETDGTEEHPTAKRRRMDEDGYNIAQNSRRPMLQSGNKSPHQHAEPLVVMRAFQAYEPGQQIFINYGPKANGELLLSYGFTIPETDTLHNDYFHLRRRRHADGTFADTQPAQDAGKSPKVHDYLISLRPINGASSVVGRTRVRFPDGFSSAKFCEGVPLSLKCFDCGMLYDLYQLQEQDWDKVVQLLSAKINDEVYKLKKTEPEEEECDQIEPATPNLAMAMQYRQQQIRILEQAATSLSACQQQLSQPGQQ